MAGALGLQHAYVNAMVPGGAAIKWSRLPITIVSLSIHNTRLYCVMLNTRNLELRGVGGGWGDERHSG